MINIAVSVLDDEVIILDLIKERFNDNSIFEVCTFSNANDFIASLSNDVDLVITDYRVTGYNAIETLKTICNDYPGIETIVISAYFTPEILRNLIKCRVTDTVEKNGAYWIDELFKVASLLIPKIENKKLLLNDT